ncbi:oxygen-dependent coproporphyrinogen oxidase [Niabella beijingensis]|uniref:oxygen-dependent coproporphyrinogen oxidase n=1 Tax=Niabella beijingensis TaxID=2872700 RepID=UPI001CC06D26|nr:oxygen-dependent coproporphyrinogen oxidase [Niabella beijingensis]MBZ4189042.1 oxygen-dependent coproporphyrinogen oxidase [Niabella beijingensis]
MKKEETNAFRQQWIEYVYGLQDRICKALEEEDGRAVFKQDNWERGADGKGGGGHSRVIEDGAVFEKAGVNVSVVYGHVTEKMKQVLPVNEGTWFACGISLVLHPENPFVPTTHANWRYFEAHDAAGNVTHRWFGGGADLTPYYLFEEDVVHFHTTLKNAIDPFGPDLYPKYKQQCDEYFSNKHRDNEMRGVGGVFYDYLYLNNEEEADRLLAFQKANGDAFLEAYLPIVKKRKHTSYAAENKKWQEIRRGRYVEFNLIHDRGTIFGLKTKGRTESILMSLPPTVRFVYNYEPEHGSLEDKLLEVCKHPREWA